MLQLLVNALALGAAYALVALGFVLILNATRAVNFAQGDLVTAGGYAAVTIASLFPPGFPGLLLLPLVALAGGGFGLLLCALAYAPLARRPATAVFVSTIAIGIILQNGANALFGAAPMAGPPLLFAGGQRAFLEIAGITIGSHQLAIIAVAALLITAVHALLEHTQTGRAMRAMADDPDMARAIGLSVTRLIWLSFALATALSMTAGLLLAHQYFVTPTEGSTLMLKAYIAVTIGGWGQLTGAVVGALLIALFEVGVAAWASQPVADGLLFLTLITLLVWRPAGLFGERAGVRA